jgi:plasmid replication initiation protein
MLPLSHDDNQTASHIAPEHAGTLKACDVRLLMAMPFFGISKSPMPESRIFDNGDVLIEVMPGALGLPTIWDKDILIYIASKRHNLRADGSLDLTKTCFRAYDFFTFCDRSPGGRSYESLVGTLHRLSTTSITMTIATEHGQIEHHTFSWIKSVRMPEQVVGGNRAPGQIEVEVDRRLWHAIDEDRSILARDSEYFKITSGLARRVYELVCDNIGSLASWSIDLQHLSKLTGYIDNERKDFKRSIFQLASADSLPEYHANITLKIGRKGNVDPSTIRGLSGLKITFTRLKSNRKLDTTCDDVRPAIIIRRKFNVI